MCKRGAKSLEIDARSSDAVAIALRCEKPIYTHDFILGSAGIIIDEDDESGSSEADPEAFHIEEFESDSGSAQKDSIADLEKQLEIALEKEDYEKASKLRDELNKRKKK